MRRSLLFLPGVLALTACGEVRARPDPLAPTDSLELSAEVVAPRTSETVRGGDSLRVRVWALERYRRLSGLGFVARRFNGTTLDSGAVYFSQRAEAIHEFAFRVPPSLASNTQIDVIGIAFGPSANAALSLTQSVIVIACTPGTTSCR